MSYIEREALRDALYEADAITMKGTAIINQFSAADVAPVVRGRWLINSDGYYPYCSVCKEEPKNGIMTHYCPNCGADNRGSEVKE